MGKMHLFRAIITVKCRCDVWANSAKEAEAMMQKQVGDDTSDAIEACEIIEISSVEEVELSGLDEIVEDSERPKSKQFGS